VADVLPHRGSAILLTRIVEHAEDRTVCLVEIGSGPPHGAAGGLVPAWVGLEYMAQCIAAHAGLHARARGEAVKVGLLVGARRVDLLTDGFRPGQTVLVTATRVWGDTGLGAFACVVRDEVTQVRLVEGTLSVVLPDSLDALRAAAGR
jgi:predicted hotdog family 3-hydroxylacyl-ACP dehydratase